MDIEKNRVELVAVKKEKEKSKCQKTFGYLDMDNCNNVVYGLDSDMNNVIINMNNGKIINIGFLIEDSVYKKVKEQFFEGNFYLNEYMFEVLELFEATYKNDLIRINDGNVGSKIYKHCC